MAIEKFRFVSPGVQVNEIDESIITPQPPATGPVVIGNTAKGPAMQPVMVSSIAELERVFGTPSNGNVGATDVWRTGASTSPTLATYAAKAFLQNSSPVTVIRLAGVAKTSEQSNEPGWSAAFTTELYAESGSEKSLLARIYSDADDVVALNTTAYPGATLVVNGITQSVSFDPKEQNFIRNALNTNPSRYTQEHYFLGETFECTTGSVTGFDTLYMTSSAGGGYTSTAGALSAASGYVISDVASGTLNYNKLFRFVGLNNGSTLAKDIKISIENVRATKNQSVTKYGTFDVVIRKLFETATQSVLERFSGVNLDPLSDNYIVKAIGDAHRNWDSVNNRYVEEGTYSNRSAYVRVEMSDEDIPATALPHGFILNAMPATLEEGAIYPNISLVEEVKMVSAKSKRFGLLSDSVKNADLVDILAFKEEEPGEGDVFNTRFISASAGMLEYTSGSYNEADLLVSGAFVGFDMPMYGGFDAKNITVVESFVNNNLLATGAGELDNPSYRAIKQAIDMVANPENIDMNVLCVPGLQNQDLTDHMLEVCKTRGDAIALIDLEGDYLYPYEADNNGKELRPVNSSTVVDNLKERTIDNSYGAAYFPAVFVPSEGIFMPASVAALGALGGTEGRQALWFAPAGFNRGGLTELTSGISVSRTALHLVSSDRDDLYDVNINPIATFPNEGVVIFGQKTLQQTPSALDRVNVRRLVNFIKKEVSRAATRILFEPNVEATWNRFKSVVDPFLLAIKNGYGLDDAKVVLDSSTTTADLVDRNIMYCKIYLKPTRALEYIAIDFVVTNNGSFFTD